MIAATVCGNLGKDAELKTTEGGKAVCNFSVATEARVRGEKVTTWVRCAMWGVRAEKVARFLTKGTKVAAQGIITTREFQGKTYLECDVSEVMLMGGGRNPHEAVEPPPRGGSGSRRRRRDGGDDGDGGGGGEFQGKTYLEIPF